MKVPYGSIDVRHVPVPDPENLWPFQAAESRTIGISGDDTVSVFRVNAIHDTWIQGTQTLGAQTVEGELHLNRPVVIERSAAGETLVTLTLRRIADGKAYIQVTVNPKLRQGRRQ